MEQAALLSRFFSTEGRTSRLRLAAIMCVIGAFVAVATEAPWDAGVIAWTALGGVIGLSLAKLLAEMAARLHDMGRSSRFGAGIGAGLGVFAAAAAAVALAGGPGWPLTAALLLVLAVLAFLLLVPGQRSVNSFGRPPNRWLRAPGPAHRAGLVLAAVLISAGAGTGGWLASTAAELRAANNAALHASATRRAIEANETDPFLK